jgi:hypothetical protein
MIDLISANGNDRSEPILPVQTMSQSERHLVIGSSGVDPKLPLVGPELGR